MSKQAFWTHWVIGLAATAVWFWGAKWGLPQAAQDLGAALVPSLVAHALGKFGAASAPSFRPAAQAAQPVAAPAAAQPEQSS